MSAPTQGDLIVTKRQVRTTLWMENENEGFDLVTLMMILVLGSTAMAESACHSQAIGKNGKPLAGAALNSFMMKCTREACEPKAIGKDGRPLAGAAKTSFMKKVPN